jgi:glutathione S-transferase
VYWLTSFKLLPERPEFMRYVERITSRPAFIRTAEKDAELAASLAH